MAESERHTSAPSESVAQAQQSIVESFGLFDSWADRYRFLIELGRQLPPFPESRQVEDNRIHGCQSGVWVVADQRDDLLFFEATSDSAIVSGLVALLLKVYSGRRPEDVLATPPTFVEQIGLAEHLSPNRANGLALMLTRIREFAAAHLPHDPADKDA